MERKEFLETKIVFGNPKGTNIELSENSDTHGNVNAMIWQRDDSKLESESYLHSKLDIMTLRKESIPVLIELLEEVIPVLREFVTNNTISRPDVKDFIEDASKAIEYNNTNTPLLEGESGDGVGDSDLG